MAVASPSTAFDNIIDRFNGAITKRNGGLMAFCPCHPDGARTGRRSLSIDVIDGKIVFKCFAGCETADIVAELGLRMSDLFLDRRDEVIRIQDRQRPRVVATYDYSDPETGEIEFQVLRYEPKSFRQRRPDGNGGWIWDTKDCRLFLYREAELIAKPEQPILLCEGEKDADNARSIGLLSTTIARGAAAWNGDYARRLAGRSVAIVPDNDDAGERFAEKAFSDLRKVTDDVCIVRLPGLESKGDLSDWIAAGGTSGQLEQLIGRARSQRNANGSAGTPHEEVILTPQPEARTWPEASPLIYYGLAGEIARAVSPYTEGDPIAAVVNYLLMFGNAVGRAPYVPIGASRHYPNEFALIVGKSSRARKGTAHEFPFLIVSSADEEWGSRAQGSGLSSGEGLIWRLRDSIKTQKNGAEQIEDDGVSDKRLLVVEEEFSATLKVSKREGSVTSELLRKCWDGRRLENMTKRSPVTATGAHVSILGHITMSDLETYASDLDIFNGTLNRFGLFLVRRSQLLPDVAEIPHEITSQMVERTSERLKAARRIGAMRRTEEAAELWRAVYPTLTEDRDGSYGALTARAEAHVLRYSMLYALTDASAEITVEHLQAAIALWQYADDSARYLFGDKFGDPVADQILAGLRVSGSLDQSEVSGLFNRHVSAGLISVALERLQRAGRIRGEKEKNTGGRPRIVWYLLAQEEDAHGPAA